MPVFNKPLTTKKGTTLAYRLGGLGERREGEVDSIDR